MAKKNNFHCEGCASKVKMLVVFLVLVNRMIIVEFSVCGCRSVTADTSMDLLAGSMEVQKLVSRLRVKLKRHVEIVPPKMKNGGDDNDDNDDNDSSGGGVDFGGGDEKKKEEDEGNGGGKMKYPAGQSGFGQFSYGKVYRHGYGYQNGALKTGEIMLLLCCEAFGLLVMYNHLANDIYTNVTLHTHHLLYI
ncbi:hypothetical protein Pyn_39240 [Prunus yedoensis var. nudiflora]|uniref:HMA domain-containing protein n=1 Tax=Prunus yedoensis var. nudiflora TaxID=2094558 RepID=A0A314YZQ2_PRUYE|nr:hypothetical protein Pyn_39240 [Prunus yedoensis var. nudiflora]